MSPQSKQSTSSSVQQQLSALSDTQQQQQLHSMVDELSGSQSVAAHASSGSSRSGAIASAVQETKASILCNGLDTDAVVGFTGSDDDVPFMQYR
eukprot:13167-Heterococcus_DN1.PRE.5